MQTTDLLVGLREINKTNIPALEQIISDPKRVVGARIPTLFSGAYLPLTPMLTARFQFAGRWTYATLGFTWLSLSDMEDLSDFSKEAIDLRKENWPTAIVNRVPLHQIGLFATSEDGEEIYLFFDTSSLEPQIVTYVGWQENFYRNLDDYITKYMSARKVR